MLYLVLGYAPSIICGVHAVQTGRRDWLWLVLVGGPIGAAVYFFAVMAPDLAGGRTGRAAAKAAKRIVAPQADYHAALKTLEETPTVGARVKAAEAAERLGRWEDAEAQWTLAAEGVFAEDPAILSGRAGALLELGRHADALAALERAQTAGAPNSGRAALAFARAYEGLGRFEEAEAPYRYAADHVPGLEAGARYVAFMAKTGRMSDAETGLAELDRRIKKIAPPLRGEARQWRDLAAEAVASGAKSAGR